MALPCRFESNGTKFQITAAKPDDFQALIAFYDDVIAYTAGTENDPRWTKGVHPSEEDLMEAIREETLWVCWACGDRVPGLVAGGQLYGGGLGAGCAAEATIVEGAEQRLAAAMIVNGEQAPGYERAPWRVQACGDEVSVLHLFATHPDFQRRGIAQHMLSFAKGISREKGAFTVRLDVIDGNEVVGRVYEKAGFVYRGTYRLDYDDVKDVDFHLYDLIL